MEIRKIEKKSIVPPYFEDTCPICNTKANGGCRCPTVNGISNDRFCANKHQWYWKDDKVVIGSHHKKEGD